MSQVNLAPDIVYVSPEYDFYLSEFLVQQGNQDWSQLISANSAHPITNNDSQCPNAEQLLLDLLNGLKNLPAPNNLMTVQTQWHIYRSRLASMHQQLTQQPNNEHPSQKAWLQGLSALIAQQDAIENMLLLLDKCIIRNQFSHRDLNPFNLLIVNGKLNCIDFEYACSSHPLCDLASVISSHTLSSEQRHWLIENYLQQQDNLNHHAQNAIPAAVDLYWVFAVCWALQMAFDCMMLDGNIIIDAASVEQTDGYLTCANQYQALIGRCS